MKPKSKWDDHPQTDLLHGDREDREAAEARTRQCYESNKQPLNERPETFNAQVTEVLRQHASCSPRVKNLMGQVLIELDDHISTRDTDALKSEIKTLIEQHFPNRTENVSIILRQPERDDSAFKVWKSA